MTVVELSEVILHLSDHNTVGNDSQEMLNVRMRWE